MRLAFIMGPSSETNVSIISPLGPEDPYRALEDLPPLDCDLGNASDGTVNSVEPAHEQYPTASSSQIATLTPPERCWESSNGKQPAEPRKEGGHSVALGGTQLEDGRSLDSNGAVVGGSGGDLTSQRVLSGQQAYPTLLSTPGSLSNGSITRESNSSDTFPQLVYPCPLPPPVSVFATANGSPFEASAPHPLDTHQQMAHSAKVQQMIVRSRSVGGGGGGGSRSGGHRISRQRSAKGWYCNAMFIREKGRISLDYGMSREQSTFLVAAGSEDPYQTDLDSFARSQPPSRTSSQRRQFPRPSLTSEVAHVADAPWGLSPAVSIQQDVKGQETMQRLLGYNSRSNSGCLPMNVRAQLPTFSEGSSMNAAGAQREVTSFDGDKNVHALSAALEAVDVVDKPGSLPQDLAHSYYSPPTKRTTASQQRSLQTAASAPMGSDIDYSISGLTPLERLMGVCKPAELSARATEAFPVLTRRYSCSMAPSDGQSVAGTSTGKSLTSQTSRKRHSSLDGWLTSHPGHSSVYGSWWFPDTDETTGGLLPAWAPNCGVRQGLESTQGTPPFAAAFDSVPPLQDGAHARSQAAPCGSNLATGGDSCVMSSGEFAARSEVLNGFRMASEMPRDIFKSLRCAGIPE